MEDSYQRVDKYFKFMKYQDHVTLEEAYSKVVEKELLTEDVQEEGLWDRVKGTASGIAKAAGRIPDAGNDTTKFRGKGGFFDEVGKGFKGGRASSVIKSHIVKLNAEIDDFINDVKKVGNVTPDSEANYEQTATFLKGIIRKIAKTAGTGKVSVSSLKSTLGQAGFLAPEKEESSEV
jgi:hypothetical protein